MLITGKIYFFRVPFGREMEDLVAFLARCAVENQIWINIGDKIKNPYARYKYSINNSESDHLTFEITDAADTDECTGILRGISYRDADFGIADWGSSSVPNIESFLKQITEHDLIEYIQLSIDLAHGYVPSEYAELNIAANKFCETLMSLPVHGTLPNGRFNIKKSDNKP